MAGYDISVCVTSFCWSLSSFLFDYLFNFYAYFNQAEQSNCESFALEGLGRKLDCNTLPHHMEIKSLDARLATLLL